MTNPLTVAQIHSEFDKETRNSECTGECAVFRGHRIPDDVLLELIRAEHPGYPVAVFDVAHSVHGIGAITAELPELGDGQNCYIAFLIRLHPTHLLDDLTLRSGLISDVLSGIKAQFPDRLDLGHGTYVFVDDPRKEEE